MHQPANFLRRCRLLSQSQDKVLKQYLEPEITRLLELFLKAKGNKAWVFLQNQLAPANSILLFFPPTPYNSQSYLILQSLNVIIIYMHRSTQVSLKTDNLIPAFSYPIFHCSATASPWILNPSHQILRTREKACTTFGEYNWPEDNWSGSIPVV